MRAEEEGGVRTRRRRASRREMNRWRKKKEENEILKKIKIYEIPKVSNLMQRIIRDNFKQ